MDPASQPRSDPSWNPAQEDHTCEGLTLLPLAQFACKLSFPQIKDPSALGPRPSKPRGFCWSDCAFSVALKADGTQWDFRPALLRPNQCSFRTTFCWEKSSVQTRQPGMSGTLYTEERLWGPQPESCAENSVSAAAALRKRLLPPRGLVLCKPETFFFSRSQKYPFEPNSSKCSTIRDMVLK